MSALRSFARRRWVRWPLIGLGGFYAFYLVAMNVLMNLPLLAQAIDPPDGSAKIAWAWGYTFFPGLATAHQFSLTVEDDNMQFGLQLASARFWCNPAELAQQTFHMTTVRGEGAVVHLRFRKSPEALAALAPDARASIPPVVGLGEVAVTRPKSAPFDGNTAGIWTVRAEDVIAQVQEIWIEGVRYVGQGTASGAFTLKPNTLVDVDARLALDSGAISLTQKRMADQLHGTMAVRVHPFNPFYEPGSRPLHFVEARLQLEGELENARFLNRALQGTTAPELASSPGRFELLAQVDRGRLAPGTRFRLRAPDWQLSSGQYQAGGNYATVEGIVTGEPETPHGRASVILGPYEVDDPAQGELIEGEGLIVRLETDRLDLLDSPLTDLGFEVQVDEARVPDLKVINGFLPPTPKFAILAGRGTLSGAFDSPSVGAGHGNLTLAASAATLRVGQVRLVGDLNVDAQLLGVAATTRRRVLVGDDLFEGQATARGKFALSDLALARGELAHFETSAELTLHPLRASTASGAALLQYLSGELKVDGQIPSLRFLGGTLAPLGIAIAGGAGQLSLDARLSHGVLGRASNLSYQATGIALQGQGLRGGGDLRVDLQVDETSDTPRASGGAELRQVRLAGADGEILRAARVRLSAESPEVDVSHLRDQRPSVTLALERLRVGQLARLNRWLPPALRFTAGQGSAQLQGRSPAQGSGGGELTVAVDGLRGEAAGVKFEGQLSLKGKAGGLAQAPWRGDILGRSHFGGSLAMRGAAHLTAKPEMDLGSTSAASAEQETSTGHLSFSLESSAEGLPSGPIDAAALWRAARGKAQVSGWLSSLAYLDRFLGKGRMGLQGAPLTLSGTVAVADGALQSGSEVQIEAPLIGVALGPFWLSGPAHARAALSSPAGGGPARAEVDAAFDRLTLWSRFRDRLLATGGRTAAGFSAETLVPARWLTEGTYHAEATALEIDDLSALTPYLPAVKDLRLRGGSATASLYARHQGGGAASGGAAEGELMVKASRAAIDLAQQAVTADLALDVKVQAELSADGGLAGPISVAGSTVEVANADFPEDQSWWLHGKVGRGELTPAEPPKVSADLAIEARDLLPVLHLYGSKAGLPGFVDGLVAFHHLRAAAALELSGNRIFLPFFEAKGDGLDFQGRLALEAQRTLGDFLLQLGPFWVGLDVRDSHAGVQLLGAGGWYRERLRHPLE